MPCVTVGKVPPLSALAAAVPDGAALDCASEVGWAEDGAADDAAAVDEASCPSGCWSVDSCGKLESSWARTAGAAASSRPNRPTEGRIARRVRRAMGVVVRSGLSRGPLKGTAWVKDDADSWPIVSQGTRLLANERMASLGRRMQ